MLTVAYVECHYAECRYTECRGTLLTSHPVKGYGTSLYVYKKAFLYLTEVNFTKAFFPTPDSGAKLYRLFRSGKCFSAGLAFIIQAIRMEPCPT